MKKVLMVVSRKDFRDSELFEPKELFEGRGIAVKIASSADQAKGSAGAAIKPDLALKDVNPEDFDAVVFVGGNGAAEYWDDPTAQQLARRAGRDNKVVAAICIAPVILARAGVLKGKHATVWYSEAGELESCGAVYTGNGTEADGRIVTASGPEQSREFARRIIAVLSR